MSSEEGEATPKDENGEDTEEDECPPPPEEEKEMLFLMEFLIDTMLLKPENMNLEGMDPCLLQGQVCVVLTFLHFPPMCLCEKEVDPCKLTGGNYIKFNAGKSLMFALSESQFENPPPLYLDVCAYKMLPHGSVPNKLPIGVTKICLGELFKQVFDKVDEKPEKFPLSKSIKDKYQLIGSKGKCTTAEITIYMRLSCLGQNVVTEFQRGGDECEPFLFKNKESQKVYQCKAKDAPDDDPEELCPAIPGWGVSTGRECGKDGGSSKTGGKEMPNCGGSQAAESFRTGPSFEEDDEYDEFATEVHGHALTIKIQKSQKRQAGVDGGLSLNKTQSLASSKAKGDSPGQVTFRLPQSENLCNKNKSSNRAIVYNMNALNADKCGAPLQMVQGVDSPDKDIFLLRIGKKGEVDGNGKLELELRTPKIKIERNIEQPEKLDKTIQTDSEEKEGKGKKKKK